MPFRLFLSIVTFFITEIANFQSLIVLLRVINVSDKLLFRICSKILNKQNHFLFIASYLRIDFKKRTCVDHIIRKVRAILGVYDVQRTCDALRFLLDRCFLHVFGKSDHCTTVRKLLLQLLTGFHHKY